MNFVEDSDYREMHQSNAINEEDIVQDTLSNNDEQNNQVIGKKRTRKLACIECRQQKTKCDLDKQEEGINRCSRCQKKNKECILQQDFKRTYKRKKSKLLEEKLLDIAKDIMKINSDETSINKRIDNTDKQKLIIQKLFNERDSIMKLLSNTEKNPTIEATPPVALPQSIIITSFSTENEIRASNNEPLITTDVLNYEIITEKSKKLEYLLNEITPKTLGNVTLYPEMIKELYLEFVNNYHIFLPVVDISKDPEIIYNLSPCLFWVIILISMRRLKRYHQPLYETAANNNNKKKAGDLSIHPNSPLKNLSVLVKNIMAEITMQPIIKYYFMDEELNNKEGKVEPILNVSSVYSVQAFLLYSFWPSSSSSLSCDTSWNTIGSAMMQSIRLGLNSAQHSVEYKTNNLQFITDQIKTWVANNVLSQYIAGTFGFPSYISLDYAILNNCELDLYGDSSKLIVLNKQLKQMLHIMKFQNHCTKKLNSNVADPLGRISEDEKFPILIKLQQDLNGIELRMKESSEIDEIRKFFILTTKISLLSNYFINSHHKKTNGNSNNSDLEDDDNKSKSADELAEEELIFTNKFLKDYSVDNADIKTKVGLTNLNNICIELIQHCHKMNQKRPDIIKYLPGVFVLNIWQAASIICKLCFSSLQTNIDLKKCKKTYDIAVKLTQGCSLIKFDLPYRSSRIMKSIWYIFENLYTEWLKKDSQEEFNLNLNIQNRLSASVFFDCLYVLKQHSGLKKKQLMLKKELLQKQSSNNKIAGGVNNDKSNARKIIATIPLDPEPITAPVTQSDRSSPHTTTPDTFSSLRSPKGESNGSKKDILDLKTILNKSSPSLNNSRTSIPAAKISRSGSPFPMLINKNVAKLDNNLNNHAKPSFVRDQHANLAAANNGTPHILNSILDHQQFNQTPLYPKSPHLINLNSVNMHMGQNSILMTPKHIGVDSPATNLLFPSLGGDPNMNNSIVSPNPVQKYNNIDMIGEINSIPSTIPSVSTKDDSESLASSNNMFLENELLWDDVDLMMNEFAFNPTV
ncbi:hypothetical protein QEN19_000855 [Hanseniaspora menglaensis]